MDSETGPLRRNSHPRDGTSPAVLLVRPLPGPRWLSVSRYADEIFVHGGLTGASLTVVEAPWWNPASVVAGAGARWWRQTAVRGAARGDFDVVHLTDHALGHHVRRFAGAHTLVTCHDVMPWFLPGYFASRGEGLLKRGFLRRSVHGMLAADHILCVSSTTAADLVRIFDYDPARISVVPNVIDDVFEPNGAAVGELSSAGIALPGGPRILSVGHSGPYKGLELLIAALAEPSLAGAWLVRAGAPLTSAQRGLASRLGVEARITQLGRVDDPTLARLYGASDVLAQPSRYEGFGIPLVEAMACGLPVVCSDGGALPEVAGGAARIVPLTASDGDDSRAFATALAEVIENHGVRAALRTAGLERACRFRPGNVMPELGRVYAALAAAEKLP
ncbi:MAG: glycosyltransferase family 4 protein [Tepidiformaceae bacterium]